MRGSGGVAVLVLAAAIATTTGCRRDMQDQPKYKPLALSHYFADGRDSRPIPAGTVARDEGDADDVVHTGMKNGSFAKTIPVPVDAQFLHRGEDRYNIFCSPCHSRTGDGDGMVHRRGFWVPPSIHTDRLRKVAPGYLFQVIDKGYGAMPGYGKQIVEELDLWAIVAYLRALQLSRSGTIEDVPEALRPTLTAKGSAPETAAGQ